MPQRIAAMPARPTRVEAQPAAALAWASRLAPACGHAAAAIALVALARRWQEAAVSVLEGDHAVMVPATAVGVLLAAIALLSQCRALRRARAAGVARVAAAMVATLGLLVVGQYVADGWNAGLRETLPDDGAWWTRRPSPVTGVGLILVAAALLALGARREAVRRWAGRAAAATLTVALSAMVGHAYGAQLLYGSGSSGGTGLSTVAALTALAVGVLLVEPERGTIAVLTNSSSGGRLLRRLLPVALLAPFLLGWLVIALQASGQLHSGFATALLVVSLTMLLVGLLVRQARVLDRLDAERERVLAGERSASEQVTNILESITDAFFAVDSDWRFTYVNRDAERLLQRPRGELIGRTVWAEFPAAVGGTFEHEYRRAMATQETVQFEAYYEPLGIWFEVRAYPAADNLSVYFHDVTDRKRAEERIRESERNFRALANSIPQLAWMADASGWIFWYSERWYEYTGTTLEEMQGWGWQKVHHPDHVARVVERIRHAFETGEPWDDTFPLRSRTGEYRWFLSRALPIRDAAGKVVRWFGTNTDVTEQRQAADALRESEERFRALAENATIGIVVIDDRSRIEFANPAMERTFGYAIAELLGRPLDTLMPEDQRQRHHAGMRRYLDTGQRHISWEGVELPGLTRDGLQIPLEISFGEFVRGGRHYFTGIIRDITWRKQAEEALRDSEERYRLLADMVPQHIWTTDADGYHTWFSRRWYEFTGADPAQSRGEGWLHRLHPDDRERTIARWEHSLRTGEPYAVEYRFRNAQGEYCWFLGQAMPQRDEDGRIVEWFGTLTDISERKQHEEERERLLVKEQAARAEAERQRAELERVTESRAGLMRGFGHDVKNPLGTAHLHAELLERQKLPGELSAKQRESVQVIRRSIRTALQLMDDLLELARAEAGQLELASVDTDVGQIAREAVDDVREQAASAGLAIGVRAPDGLHARTDPVRLRQILSNLLVNAVKYAPQGRMEVVAEARAAGAPRPGAWIAVDVADTGPGIPPDKQELIFHEYSRLTPESAPGVGLGLAISRRLARLMGGELTVASAIGRGATFTLWLPRSAPSD